MSVAVAQEGFVTLRQAAQKIGRSTARTRQYVHDGKLEWKRNEMGQLLVSEASLAAFSPPERGDARASGVSSGTQLRHARAAKKLVNELIVEGPAKATAIQILNAVIASLSEKAATEATADPDAAEEIEDAEDDEADTEETPAAPQDFSNLLNKL